MSAGPRLARRTTLALAAGLVVLAGCDDGDGPDGLDDPDGAGSPGPTTAPDPDVALVEGVLAELARAERVAAAAGDADLIALHRAHIEALDGTPATSPTPGRSRATDVRSREHRLQAHLVEAAVAAESGALAALLASMSAAQSQVLAQGAGRR